MKDQILFEEKQSFRQWWLWFILLGVSGFYFYCILSNGRTISDLLSNPVIIFTSILVMILLLCFLIYRLETQVRTDGIYIRFFPFTLKFKKYPFEEISKAYIRQYNAIMEFGGWGYRIGWKKKAFNVSGNQGLQLEFNDDNKLLIGTQKPDELAAVIEFHGGRPSLQ